MLPIAALLLALLPIGPRAAEQRVDLVNGVGLIDYSHRQHFKPGSWVKYRVRGSSEGGMTDDYGVTILIAGNETFWGEECFWVETLTEPKDKPPRAIATLMSYSIFDDSLPVQRMPLYTRKVISELDGDGNPVENVTKRPASAFKSREPTKEKLTVTFDTLGVDTVVTPFATYNCRKVVIRQGVGANADVGDSTLRTEERENRTVYLSDKIPITGLAREDVETLMQRRAWKIGKSQDAPMRVMDHATGSARVTGFGAGLEPMLVPAQFRANPPERGAGSSGPPPAKPRPKSGRQKTG
jgi:hypothetical protein